jgi:hypothetical protein
MYNGSQPSLPRIKCVHEMNEMTALEVSEHSEFFVTNLG